MGLTVSKSMLRKVKLRGFYVFNGLEEIGIFRVDWMGKGCWLEL